MKTYDFTKAKKIIAKEKENLRSAYLGMHEDWFWTAIDVWEDGKYKIQLKKDTLIVGINGSYWATPTLQLIYKDGKERMIEVSKGENYKKESPLQLGVLSGPVQEKITPLEK